MTRLLLILFVLVFSTCSKKNSQTYTTENQILQKSSNQVNTKKLNEKVEIKKSEFIDDSSIVNGSIGLLCIDTYSKSEWIIKNLDNTIFKSFDFSQPESKNYYKLLDSIINNFELFVYKPDYDIIFFNAI